jgi:hypothetical protein
VLHPGSRRTFGRGSETEFAAVFSAERGVMKAVTIELTESVSRALEDEARRRQVAPEEAAAELLSQALADGDRGTLERAAEIMERRREVLRELAR